MTTILLLVLGVVVLVQNVTLIYAVLAISRLTKITKCQSVLMVTALKERGE